MLRRLLILLLLLGGLVALDRGQRDAAAERRQEMLKVRKIMGTVISAERPVAVIRVTEGDGRAAVYGQKDGFWRCFTYRSAPARMDRLEQLVLGLTNAQGVVLTENPSRPKDYGLDVPAMRTISLHGPAASAQDLNADLIASVDIGAAVVGAEGCYARIHGQSAIWTIDDDPGALTGREPTPLPSLIDPALVPSAWPGPDAAPRVKNVMVALPGRDAYELEVRDKPVTPEEAARGVPGFEWILRNGGVESVAPIHLAMAYTSYLVAAPWSAVLDAAALPTAGLDKPRAIATLRAGGGQALRVALAGHAASGRPVVYTEATRTAFEVEPAQETLLFPPAEMFAPDATENPWDAAREKP